MKKFVFTIGVCLLFLFSTQTEAQTAIIFGPDAGVHLAKVDFSGDADLFGDYSRQLMFQGGLNFGVQFGQWGIMSGIRFNQKGGKATLERRDPNNPFVVGVDGDGNLITDVGILRYSESSNWISIPLMGRVQLGQGPLKFGIGLGPQFNLGIGKLNQKLEYDLNSTNLQDVEENTTYGDSADNVYKKSHISLVVNPSVWYELSPNSAIKFGLMFESGGNMINDNYLTPDPNTGNMRLINATSKSNNLGFLIGYEHRFDINVGVKY